MTTEPGDALDTYTLTLNGVARDNLIALVNDLRPDLIVKKDWDGLEALEYLAISLQEASTE